jgi:hypothetical protein
VRRKKTASSMGRTRSVTPDDVDGVMVQMPSAMATASTMQR